MPKKALNITILGFGNVGKNIAALLLLEGHHIQLNCMDVDESQWGAFLDIEQASLVSKKVKMSWNDFDAFRKADFIIHTAGGHIPPGGDRLAVAGSTIDMIDRAYAAHAFSPKTKVIVLSNPVDVSCYFIHKYTGIPTEQIFGVGTLVDSFRLRYYLARKCKLGHELVSAWALGEHGKSMVPIYSHTLIDGREVREFLSKEEIQSCIDDTIATPVLIRQTQEASIYLAARCAVFLLKSLLNPQDEAIPLSVFLNDHNQKRLEVDSIFLSVPVKITKHGVNQLLDFELDELELSLLRKSARLIKRNIVLFEQISKAD